MKHTNTRSLNIKGAMIIALSATLTLAGCVSGETKSEREMNSKVSSQPQANTPEQIRERAAEAFINSPSLTADQKKKLTEVYMRTYGEAMTIRKEIGQSKSLLFELLATADYKSKEVQAIKQKIVGLDQKRMDVMFKAMADVQAIVGFGKGTEDIYKHLRENEFPRPGHMLGEY